MLPSLVRFFGAWLVTTIVSLPVLVGLVICAPFRHLRMRVLHLGGRVVASSVLWCMGAKAVLIGAENLNVSQPSIYVANHSSGLDTVLIPWLGVPTTVFVLKREALFIPLLGQALWLGGHVFIDRRSPSRAVASLKSLSELLRSKGLGVWIMPEGTRSKTGELGRFKTGFVHLALATGYPVVPISIRGAKEVWPNGTWRLYPGAVAIEVMPPIPTRDWCADSKNEHAAYVRNQIASALNKKQD